MKYADLRTRIAELLALLADIHEGIDWEYVLDDRVTSRRDQHGALYLRIEDALGIQNDEPEDEEGNAA